MAQAGLSAACLSALVPGTTGDGAIRAGVITDTDIAPVGADTAIAAATDIEADTPEPALRTAATAVIATAAAPVGLAPGPAAATQSAASAVDITVVVVDSMAVAVVDSTAAAATDKFS